MRAERVELTWAESFLQAYIRLKSQGDEVVRQAATRPK